MKKCTQGFTTLMAFVIIAVFVVGTVYFFNKSPITLVKNNEGNYNPPETNRTEMQEYVNAKYHFKFSYPASWTIEEKNLPDFFGDAIGKDFYTGLAVVMSNPDFPKKVYDCCYTPEEVEKYGEKPTLVLMIIESISYPSQVTKETFGRKTKNIFNELTAKGYSPKISEQLLSFVPSVGEYIDTDGQNTKTTLWNDACSEVKLLSINSNYIVKFSGCHEGVVQNTGALFARKDNFIFQLEDYTSEYSNRGDFDKILESFEFN